MNKFDQFLIVSDLDGTFFGENSQLLDRNLEAVRYFADNGGIFTIATGRDYRTIETVFPQLSEYLSGPAILCNGAYLYDFRTGTVMEEEELHKDEFLTVLNIFTEKFKNTGYRVSTHEGYLCPYISPFMETRIKKILPLIIRSDLEKHMNEAWHKCVFVAEPEIIDEMERFAATLALKDLTTVTSFSTLFEVLPKNAGKSAKLNDLKSYYPERKAICVGEYTNDIDM